LELRLPTEDELVQLAGVARLGVHPPADMPFLVPWTDDLQSETFVESFVGYHLGARAAWRLDEWRLELGAWRDRELMGAQGIHAGSFALERTAYSGSWLAQKFQGKGYGTEMRAAILKLAFCGLGALAAGSTALDGNVASARVSAKLGYENAGEGLRLIRGEPTRERRFLLSRERWEQSAHPRVELAGLAPCLPLFGVSGARRPRPA
jgi:RimJ/RimL family protein N-acetyltransferase